MKNQLRNLIIALAALAIIVLGFFLFRKFANDPLNEASEASAASAEDEKEAVNIWQFDMGDFESLSIVNKKSEYTILRKDNNFYVEGFENLPREEKTYSMLEAINALDATDEIKKDNINLSDYGLDKPVTTVGLKFNSGGTSKSVDLEIGNAAPKDNDVYVKLKDDSSKIYTVDSSALSVFEVGKNSYVSKAMTPISDSQKSFNIKKLTIGGSSQNGKDMVFEPAELNPEMQAMGAGYKMLEPVQHDADTNKISELLSVTLQLVAVDIAKANVSEDDLAEYGLDRPLATVSGEVIEILQSDIDEEGNKIVEEQASIDYIIGDKNEDGFYYALRRDVPIVYVVNASSVFYVEQSFIDFMSKMLLVPYIFTVDEVDVTFSDAFASKDKDFKIIHTIKNDEAKSENDSAAPVIDNVSINDKEVDVESYKKLYQVMISLRGEQAVSDEIINEYKNKQPDLTITYKYSDSEKSNSVAELVLVDDRNALIIVDGESYFTIRSLYIDKIYEYINMLLDGKEITSADW